MGVEKDAPAVPGAPATSHVPTSPPGEAEAELVSEEVKLLRSLEQEQSGCFVRQLLQMFCQLLDHDVVI